MGTGWELVRQGPLSRTQHLAATGCSRCPRAGPASASFATVSRSDYEHQSWTRVIAGAGGGPREPAPLPPASEVGQGTRHSPRERLPGEASGRKLQNRTWGRTGLRARSQAVGRPPWPHAPNHCVPAAEEGETAVCASKTPAPTAVTTG